MAASPRASPDRRSWPTPAAPTNGFSAPGWLINSEGVSAETSRRPREGGGRCRFTRAPLIKAAGGARLRGGDGYRQRRFTTPKPPMPSTQKGRHAAALDPRFRGDDAFLTHALSARGEMRHLILASLNSTCLRARGSY